MWIINHVWDVINAVLAVLGAASVIAKLTPTPKDDEIIKKIIHYIGLTKKLK